LLGEDLEEACLPDPARAREPQHGEQRLGGLESGTEELELGLASDEAPATA
jgi:hypothetical protein